MVRTKHTERKARCSLQSAMSVARAALSSSLVTLSAQLTSQSVPTVAASHRRSDLSVVTPAGRRVWPCRVRGCSRIYQQRQRVSPHTKVAYGLQASYGLPVVACARVSVSTALAAAFSLYNQNRLWRSGKRSAAARRLRQVNYFSATKLQQKFYAVWLLLRCRMAVIHYCQSAVRR